MKRRPVETISRKTLLRLRNFWYLVDRAVQVPKDIILEPRTIGMLEWLSLLFDENSNSERKIVKCFCITWRLAGLGQGLVPPKLCL